MVLAVVLLGAILPAASVVPAHATVQQAIVLKYSLVASKSLSIMLRDPTDLRLTVTSIHGSTFVDIPDATGLKEVGSHTDAWAVIDLKQVAEGGVLSGDIGEVTVEIGPQPGKTASLLQLGMHTATWNQTRRESSQGQMVEVVSLGSLGLQSLGGAFRNTQNLLVTASLPESVTSLSYFAFSAGGNFRGVSNWDTSRVTTLDNAFNTVTAFNEDISTWDVSNVTNLTAAFFSAQAFNQDISRWNTSKVTSLTQTFSRASSFNQDISGWDTSKVTTLTQTFNQASSFNQNISTWDTTNVTSMQSLFTNASAFNQNLGAWNVEKVTLMAAILTGSGMSNSNYASTLEGWAAQSVLSGVSLGAVGLIADTCARVYLADSKGWVFQDGLNIFDFSTGSFVEQQVLTDRRTACTTGPAATIT